MSNPRTALDTIGHYLLLTLQDHDSARRELTDAIEGLQSWCDEVDAKTKARPSGETGPG